METIIKYPKKAGIYKLTCSFNSKIYIGKSVNLYARLNRHKNCNKSHARRGFLQNAIIKYGWESFSVEVLEIFEDFDNIKDNIPLLEREAYYIELFNCADRDKGYNVCKYSNDGTGIPLSENHKENIRLSKLGKPHTEDHKEKLRYGKLINPMSQESRDKLRKVNLGKTMSQETRKKMSISKTGRKLSDETRQKISEGNLGRKVSEETKEKMRKPKLTNGNLGRPRSEETKEKIRQTKLKNK